MGWGTQLEEVPPQQWLLCVAKGVGLGSGHGFPCILKSPLIPREQLAQCWAGGSVWGWL